MEQSYVGIDVCKKRLEVVVRGGDIATPSFHVANTEGGCKSLVDKLTGYSVAMVALEATGGYELKAWERLAEAGIPVTVLNPLRARAFAHFKGTLSKTDKVDAAILAEIAEQGRLNPTSPPDKHLQRLTALMIRREQVVGMLTMEKNRSGHGMDVTEPWIQRHIEVLTAERRQLDREIEAVVRANPAWQENDRLLRSIKGIGPVTSAAIIAYLPEIGTLPHKKLAALVGVAPFAADSGNRSGVRFIRGGRGRVRHAFYMAALSACRAEGPVKSFYRRLLDTGKKPKKVAQVACMHKLLRIANAVVRDGQLWDPDWRNVAAAAHVMDRPESEPRPQSSDAAPTCVKEVGGLGGGAPQDPLSPEFTAASRRGLTTSGRDLVGTGASDEGHMEA